MIYCRYFKVLKVVWCRCLGFQIELWCRFWLGNCFGYFFQKIGGIFFSLSGHPEETQSLGGADSILFCFSWLIFSFVVENFNCRNHNWAVQSNLDTEKKCWSCNFYHIFISSIPVAWTIKLFWALIDVVSKQARVFATAIHFYY